MTLIGDKDVVLFQGDSITDAGRSRSDLSDLGSGYAGMVAAWFAAQYPDKRVSFINRGISGNRAKDLRSRWSQDCIDLKPNWVSIMIGINDTWRRYDSGDATTTSEYEENYRALLDGIRKHLPAQTQILLIEPFVLPVPPDRAAWREDLDPKISVVRRLAREFGTLYVPMDGLFAAACAQREPAFWAFDGVHPSQAGHALIAQAWLRTVKAI